MSPEHITKSVKEQLRDLGVVYGLADLHALQLLLEGEGHPARDDHLVHAVEHVVDQFDLIRDLRAVPASEAQSSCYITLESIWKLEYIFWMECGWIGRQGGPSENGEQGPLRALKNLGEVVELLLHEKSTGARWVHAHHRAADAQQRRNT